MSLNGIFVPPRVVLIVGGQTISQVAFVLELAKFLGAEIGSAVISYRKDYAADLPTSGQSLVLKLGGTVVFRGIVLEAPADITVDKDEAALKAACDKELLALQTIGEVGIGTADGGGFSEVGYDVVFNPDGVPNKAADALDFCLGDAAVAWTLADVAEFIFEYYVDAVRVSFSRTGLSTAWSEAAPELNLIGQTALQAVQSVAELAGESWTLVYGASKSEFKAVKPGGTGTAKVRLFPPKSRATADSVTDYHCAELQATKSIQDVRNCHKAMSGRAWVETTLTSVAPDSGDATLERDVAFIDADEKYVASFVPVVDSYEAAQLGFNLSAGAKPKEWREKLCTRVVDGVYKTAAEMAADKKLRTADQVDKPVVWIRTHEPEGDDNVWLPCVGGYKIDAAAARISFQKKLTVAITDELSDAVSTLNDDELFEEWNVSSVEPAGSIGDDDRQLLNLSLDTDYLDCKVTIATSVEKRMTATATRAGSVLRSQPIQRDDLVPEYRYKSELPDLGDPTDTVTLADTLEAYVDVQDELQKIADRSLTLSPAEAIKVSAVLPFLPHFEIGDRLDVDGRDAGLSGDEVVTEIAYRFIDGVANSVSVKATNSMIGGAK